MDELDWKVLRIVGIVIFSPVLIPYWVVRGMWRGCASATQERGRRLREWRANIERERDRVRCRKEQQKFDADKRRRAKARARCELFYAQHAPEIGKRFTKPMLDAFFQQYMGEEWTPEEVDERGLQLEEVLNEHRAAVCPSPRFAHIEDLAAWFVAEKRRIEYLPVDEMFREQHLVQLHVQYAELSQKLMEQQQ